MTDIVDRLNDSLSAGYSELRKEAAAEITRLRARIEAMEQQEPIAFALYSGWARKAVYLSEIEACEQRDRRQLTADLGGSLEAYRVVPLYRAPGAQPTPSFADAYQGAMEDVAIWKKRALEAEDLNRKFVAEINGPAYMGEPAQPAPSIPEGVKKVTRGFHWNGAAQHHTPTIEVEFEPVPAGSPNNAKGWQDRDRLAAMLAAAPEAKP